MRYIIQILILAILPLGNAFTQIIQISGVTMTSDSMETVPFVSIQVNEQDLGDRSNYNGVFSLVCRKGDILTFSSMGYGTKKFTVPTTLKGTQYTMIQFMDQDTFYLPEVIFKQELPTGRDFDYAFRYWDMDEDMFVVAKRNTNTNEMEYQRYTLPLSGAEAQSSYLRQESTTSSYRGMVPSGINLLRVPEFINAWKRGDLKRKK